MSTCLDDLNVTLNAILTALDGNGGEEAPSISITTKAAADASAVANAFALTNVQLQAVAVATANAIAMVDVDISLTLEQTTTVVNQVLPPVSVLVPPDITVFPELETGVSDTPRTGTTPGGDTCKAIYEVLDNIQAFVTSLAKYPIWGLDTTYDLLTAVLGAVGALEFFLALRGWILPKSSIVAITSLLTALLATGVAVQELLDNTAMYLLVERDALAEQIFCLYFNGASTLDVISSVHDVVAAAQGEPAAHLVGILLSPNVLAAMLYDSSLIDASAQVEDCDFICGV